MTSEPGEEREVGRSATEAHASAEDLAAYIDGRVDSTEWRRLVAHLAGCDACFADLVSILKLVHGEAGPPPHPSLSQRRHPRPAADDDC